MRKNILKQHIGYWLNRLTTCTHQGFEKKLSQHDISVSKWCILVSLFDKSANSVGELSTYIEVDKGSISRMVENLVQNGLVMHGPGADKRSGKLSLTDQGKAIVPKLILEAEANEQEFFGSLSMDEFEQLRSLLHKIIINIPSIFVDGWLKKGNNMTLKNTVEAILNQSESEKWSYAKRVDAFRDAGISSYHVCFGTRSIVYNGATNSYEDKPSVLLPEITIVDQFSAEGGKDAIRRHMMGETNYVTWVQDMTAAGVSHYNVDILGRAITYYNKDETDSFVENVPPNGMDPLAISH